MAFVDVVVEAAVEGRWVGGVVGCDELQSRGPCLGAGGLVEWRFEQSLANVGVGAGAGRRAMAFGSVALKVCRGGVDVVVGCGLA